MRIIKKEPLLNFASKHPTLRSAIDTFIAMVEKSDWQTPEEAVLTFGQARTDTFANERVCVNIGGGKCRVVIKARYGWRKVYVKWIGLHNDYTKMLEQGQKLENL
ncbi:MAG: hypothetical protein DRI69_10695 [Bacteroidetes bacterium]|nr:MAG: hypothetical protein DRI69_10695 [Bacteroidota bacterium]